jgi:hypothetical protein
VCDRLYDWVKIYAISVGVPASITISNLSSARVHLIDIFNGESGIHELSISETRVIRSDGPEILRIEDRSIQFRFHHHLDAIVLVILEGLVCGFRILEA